MTIKDIIDRDDEECFSFEKIKDMDHAERVLEDCYFVICELAGNDSEVISRACRSLGIQDPWEDLYGTVERKEKSPEEKQCCSYKNLFRDALSLLIRWKFYSDGHRNIDEDRRLQSLHGKTVNFLVKEIKNEIPEMRMEDAAVKMRIGGAQDIGSIPEPTE